MNIIINQRKLLSAVKSVERIVSKNITLPILNSILIKAEGGRAVFTATNLEMGIRYTVGAKVDQEGVLAVPARILSEFISTIQDEKITLVGDKNTLTITSEHYTTQILCMNAEEFPIIPTLKNSTEFLIAGSLLKSGISSVIDSTSLLETRPELSGIFVTVEAKKITLAATDSFRLSERVIPLQAGSPKTFIIPRATAMEVMRLAGDHDGDIRLGISENQIAARGEDFELISRLIDGRYPDYKKVIPEKFTSSIEVSKEELDRGVRMASIFSSSISDLSLKASSTGIQLMAKNSDRGEIAASIPASGIKSPFEVSVNYRYLLDGLKVINSDTVVIGFTGQGSPLVLRGKGVDDYVYVIMPLRA